MRSLTHDQVRVHLAAETLLATLSATVRAGGVHFLVEDARRATRALSAQAASVATNDVDPATLTPPAEVTWTFFGYWADDGSLLIDHAVIGEHDDVYPNDGQYDGGPWCASASGASLADAEAAVRAEYESDEQEG